jgi:signal transduction histidine kinase
LKPYWRLTLRYRTALIITLFIWVTGLLVGWVCRSSFQALLLRQSDIDMAEDFNDFRQLIRQEKLPFSSAKKEAWNRRLAVHPLHHLFIRVVDTEGQPIWESITAPTIPPTSDNIDPKVVQIVGEFRFMQEGLDLQRASTVDGMGERSVVPAILQLGCSEYLVDMTIAQFDGWLISAVGPLFLGAPILAVLLASWLLKPLTQLTETTQSIPIVSEQLIERSGNRDEIDALAETINSLLIKVRSQLRENEDWIANSAHQLRAPLAAIISNVEVVASRIPDGKSSDMLRRVLSECEYLKKLVNQLLLLSEARADRHQLVRQELAWNELLSKSSDFYEALASARDLHIRFLHIDRCVVSANPEHLRFVIHNLIDNAIKYTPTGGTIDVSLLRDDVNKQCTLTIRDTGIGISEEDLPKIGRRFFRSNSGRDPSQTPRGTGLGLHIVKSIVETAGGQLEIASKLGHGTEVRVSLPIATTQSTGESSRSRADIPASEPAESSR